MIVGVAIAALLHVTVAVGAVTAAYQLAEKRLQFWAPPQMTLKIFGTLAALAMVALTIWICVR